MAKKTARVYTLDELKEKSREALADPKLVEIVKNTPLNKDGKVNLSWVYGQAEDYVHEQTKDLQKTKELAVAARFLAMLRRDFAEDFKKLTAQKKPELEVGPVKKRSLDEIEFPLPHESYLITKRNGCGTAWDENFIKFYDDGDTNFSVGRRVARSLCIKIMHALIETSNPHPDKDLLDDLIQLLEEKFGLKVRVCEHCNYFTSDFIPNKGCDSQEKFLPWFGACTYCLRVDEFSTIDYRPLGKPNYSCGLWTPKKSPEKSSSS